MVISSKFVGQRWLWTGIAMSICGLEVIATSTSRGDSLDVIAARRDEERALLAQQNQVDAQLDKLLLEMNEGGVPTTQRNKSLQRSQTLDLMRQTISARLKDLQHEIRTLTRKQEEELFAGTFDVYLDSAELTAGKPSVHGATFDRQLEFNGHRYVRLYTSHGWIVIDPAKIVAVKSCPTTRPSDGTL